MDYANLIAAIQGIIAAISVWQAERDYLKTQETYQNVFLETLQAPDIEARAFALEQVLPPYIADTFRSNLEMCWERFNGCIKGASREEEIVPCEETNQECICSNLRGILRSNGSLPSDLHSLWMQFGCGPKPRVSLPVQTSVSAYETAQVAVRQFQQFNS